MPQPQSTGPSHFQRVIVIPAYLDVIDTAGGKWTHAVAERARGAFLLRKLTGCAKPLSLATQ